MSKIGDGVRTICCALVALLLIGGLISCAEDDTVAQIMR